MIAYIAHGFGYCNISSASLEMQENDIILINSNAENNFTAQPDTQRMDIYYCCFFPEVSNIWEHLVREYPNHADFFDGRASYMVLTDSSGRELRDIFIRMIDEQMERRKDNDEVMKAYLDVLLLKLFRTEAEREKAITYRNNTVDRTIRYINRHIYRQVSLKELSEYHHMTTFYLCRTFKKYTGMTIKEYALKMRLEHIADILKNTNRPIEEILEAYDLGAGYLKQSFRESYGMNMKEYRKKYYYRGREM